MSGITFKRIAPDESRIRKVAIERLRAHPFFR